VLKPLVRPIYLLTVLLACQDCRMMKKRCIGRFPSGKNLGSGISVRYPPSIVGASYQGSLMTTEGGDQFLLRGSRIGQRLKAESQRNKHSNRICTFTKKVSLDG
jgi:hypothetical protein